MTDLTKASPGGLLGRAITGSVLAGLGSAAVMAWRGRVDNGAATSGLNPPSHWIWGDIGIREDRPTLRYTFVGLAVHQVSALLWSTVYGLVRKRRRTNALSGAIGDAVAVTALAAAVDLKIVPHRLTPGFQQRLTKRSLCWVYAGFAAGLALTGIAAAVQQRSPRSRGGRRA